MSRSNPTTRKLIEQSLRKIAPPAACWRRWLAAARAEKAATDDIRKLAELIIQVDRKVTSQDEQNEVNGVRLQKLLQHAESQGMSEQETHRLARLYSINGSKASSRRSS